MKNIFCPILLWLLLVSPRVSSDEERREFDVSAGDFVVLKSITPKPTEGYECEIRISEFRRNENWSPSFIMLLSERGIEKDDEEGTGIRVTVTKDEDNEFYSFGLTKVETEEIVYNSNFLKLTANSELITLAIGWRDDGVIIYEGRDDAGQTGQGYVLIPKFQPKYFTIAASGIKGDAKCHAYEI